MKRLLCLISGMNAGGAETFLMKLYRQLDKSRYQMDFCINVSEKCFYEDEILGMGGRIYRIPAKSRNRKEFVAQLGTLVREHGYEYVLRVTSNAMGFWDIKIAKQAGARVCAVRSSNSADGGSLKHWAAHKIGRILYAKYVEVKIAPSDLAAKYTFGNKAYQNGEVAILHNAIDLSVFRYDAPGRAAIREEFGLRSDTLLIGHVGRFNQQKNHKFLIEVFQEISRKRPDAMLMLVGKGDLEEEIKKQIHQFGLDDKVIFTGVRSDIPQLLSAMDVFVMPSFYEGMPNTVIEAQATGLPCVIADTITGEADITGLVTYLPLTASAETWADTALAAVCDVRKDTHRIFLEKQYDIQSTTDAFVRLCFPE